MQACHWLAMATQDTHPDKLESDLDIHREVHAKFATIDATSVGKSIVTRCALEFCCFMIEVELRS